MQRSGAIFANAGVASVDDVKHIEKKGQFHGSLCRPDRTRLMRYRGFRMSTKLVSIDLIFDDSVHFYREVNQITSITYVPDVKYLQFQSEANDKQPFVPSLVICGDASIL
ncbi:hypothetical protein AYL99_03542 [Fonsecaea erecta]|uniref:Uncharacterized protein n=1 Tax=Fonsecaea erecta TaxID=1367422 RepID=A0A178ZNE9_9EURO|nr:hypothetical protein AYL99_03542 [Fonsecaea erecta]OAP61339.1 hypothetical protein AYL99_03542 [Fonsecaea erecta]